MGLTDAEVDQGVNDLIDLVVAVDAVITTQAEADAAYFLENCEGGYDDVQSMAAREVMRQAYRWQYIVSGVQLERFQQGLAQKVTAEQMERVQQALTPLVTDVTGDQPPAQ